MQYFVSISFYLTSLLQLLDCISQNLPENDEIIS